MRARQCDPINGCGMLYQYELVRCPTCNTPQEFSIDMGYDPRHYIYDEECYPNVFTICILHPNTGQYREFEISDRFDDTELMMMFLKPFRYDGGIFIGFNNVGYDYPLLHFIISTYEHYGKATPAEIYAESDRIINTDWNDRFTNRIWESDQFIEQIDLFMIHHFDNSAKSTSLKQIEFAMRSENIKDLPYQVGTHLEPHEIDNLRTYGKFDVEKTFEFYKESIPMIEFREGLSEKYDKNMMNHNDTKIGKDIVIHKLGRDLCFERDGTKRQSPRDYIHLEKAIFPYIEFKNPEFNRIKNYLSQQVISETKGVFSELECTVDGLRYVFGLGGLHASLPGQTLHSNHEYIMVDIDVRAYYPSLGIANKISPEHLGDEYFPVVEELKAERLKFKKGTLENAAYKLAMNSGFGNSNNKYTPFYDPLYTMMITINGQLLLCMLAETLLTIPSMSIIQCNTDGITYRCKRKDVMQSRIAYKHWEKFTCLDLEEAIYRSMYIKDVNNYISVYQNGDVKRKGAYAYKKEWHQNHSALVVAKAVNAHLLHFTDIREFIINHDDPYDFMSFVKSGQKDILRIGDTVLQRRSRYYVGISGGQMSIERPPTGVLGHFKKNNNTSKPVYAESDNTVWNPEIHTKNKSVHVQRLTGIESGWSCVDCNDINTFKRSNLNYEYYIQEAMKLVEGVSRVIPNQKSKQIYDDPVFNENWKRSASNGQCDEIGGMEYQRAYNQKLVEGVSG